MYLNKSVLKQKHTGKMKHNKRTKQKNTLNDGIKGKNRTNEMNLGLPLYWLVMERVTQTAHSKMCVRDGEMLSRIQRIFVGVVAFFVIVVVVGQNDGYFCCCYFSVMLLLFFLLPARESCFLLRFISSECCIRLTTHSHTN